MTQSRGMACTVMRNGWTTLHLAPPSHMVGHIAQLGGSHEGRSGSVGTGACGIAAGTAGSAVAAVVAAIAAVVASLVMVAVVDGVYLLEHQ
jgi:hypothetical protein